MYFFDKFEIKKNKSSFKQKKQNLFIVIRKSPGEYDFIIYFKWIKKNLIFFIFNNYSSYKLKKTNIFCNFINCLDIWLIQNIDSFIQEFIKIY